MEQASSAPPGHAAYPVQLSIDYPDRPLNRLTTAFRVFTAIPILIVVAALVVYAAGSAYGSLLNVVGRQRGFLLLQLVAICVDVTVAVVLVNRGFGLEGIALAFLIAMSLYGSLLRLTALRVTRDLDDSPPRAGSTPETHVPAAA
jgi:Na+-driven multidrug efflux pump